jgi:hypothetical protein
MHVRLMQSLKLFPCFNFQSNMHKVKVEINVCNNNQKPWIFNFQNHIV